MPDPFAQYAVSQHDDPFAAFAAAPAVSAPTTEQILTHDPKLFATSDSPDGEPSMLERAIEGLRPAAHPQTLGDFSQLLIPAGVETAVAAGRGYLSAAKQAAVEAPTLKKLPGAMLKVLYRNATTAKDYEGDALRAFNDMPLAQQMEHFPTNGPVPERVPRSGPPTRVGAPTPTDPTEALMVKEIEAGRLPQSVLDGYRKNRPMAGRLKMAPSHEPTVAPTVDAPPASAPRGSAKGAAQMDLKPKVRALSEGEEQGIRDLDALQEALRGSDTAPLGNGTFREPPQASHPLDPMRRDIGAQATARQSGMTTQQVRQQATPILGAQPGEASPILPDAPFKRMVDTMKALPREGAARSDYVAKAASGKTQWQLENLRRTLEHLGLVAPVAAATPTLRDAVMERLRGRATPYAGPSDQ